MPFDGRDYWNPKIEGLERARALIDKPEKWCQGELYKRDIHGARRCIVGALNEVGVHPDVRLALLAAGRVLGHSLVESIEHFNDLKATTHERVMEAFDLARLRLLCPQVPRAGYLARLRRAIALRFA